MSVETQTIEQEILTDARGDRASATYLAMRGAVVDVDVTCWRAMTRVTLQDLGIRVAEGVDQKKLEKIMHLGQIAQMPEEYRKKQTTAENGPRVVLSRWAFKTLGLSFVPVGVYQRWKDEHAQAAVKFQEFVQELRRDWDEIMVLLRRDYEILAQQAWDSANRGGFVDAGVSGYRWRADYVDALMRRVPTIDQALAQYSVRASLTLLDLGGGQDANPADTARSDQERAMLADIKLDQERQRQENATKFLVDVQAQLLESLGDLAVSVVREQDRAAASGTSGGGLSGGVVKGLRLTTERAILMNLTDDPEITALANALRQFGEDGPEVRAANRSSMRVIARCIAAIAKQRLIGLGRSDALNVREIMEPASVNMIARQGRSMFNLEDVVLPESLVTRGERAETGVTIAAIPVPIDKPAPDPEPEPTPAPAAPDDPFAGIGIVVKRARAGAPVTLDVSW